jgi:hypothetical protein
MSGYIPSEREPISREQKVALVAAVGGEALPPPPTWVERIGIACLFLGTAMIFAYLGGQWGLIPKIIIVATALAVCAVTAATIFHFKGA